MARQSSSSVGRFFPAVALLLLVLCLADCARAEKYADRFAAIRVKQHEAVDRIQHESFSVADQLKFSATLLHHLFDTLTLAWQALKRVDLAKPNLNMGDAITRQFVTSVLENTA